MTYDVYPYGLTYHRGSLYLIGWTPDHEEIRHWKDRIEAQRRPFAWWIGVVLDHYSRRMIVTPRFKEEVPPRVTGGVLEPGKILQVRQEEYAG